MKKLILLFFAIIFLVLPTSAYAQWDDCTKGLENDPYPGSCGRYIDTDGDGICDHSQPAPEDRETTTSNNTSEITNVVGGVDPMELITGEDLKYKTVAEVAQLYQLDLDEFINALKDKTGIKAISANTSFTYLHDNYGLSPNTVKTIATALWEQNQGNTQALSQIQATSTQQQAKNNYYFLLLSLGLIGSYLTTFILSRLHIISTIKHRQIWNIFLSATFLATGLLGIFLVLRLSYGLVIPLPFNMLFWHVETGIAFTVIALFHIFWHIPYYKSIWPKK